MKKYGGLPHLSFIERKPKKFGIELKTVCTADGLLFYMEIQEGKERMAAHLIEGYDPGPSKTGRLCAHANEGMVVIGDADFGSVPAAYLLAKQGKGCILNVKNAHKFFPKEFLEKHLAG